MGVDKSYGSGKSRSAANSSARRRVAAGKLTKRPKKYDIAASRKRLAASPLGQLADTVLGFALPVGKVKAAANAARIAGMGARASQLEARALAKVAGQEAGKRFAKANNPSTVFGVGRTGEQVLSDYIRGAQGVGKITREASQGVFPRVGGAGTTVRRGRGTVNQKGLEKMIAGGREPRVPRGAGKVKPEEYTTLPTGTRVLKKDLVRSKMLNQYLGSGKTKRGGR